mgnify:CR=1 FL=1
MISPVVIVLPLVSLSAQAGAASAAAKTVAAIILVVIMVFSFVGVLYGLFFRLTHPANLVVYLLDCQLIPSAVAAKAARKSSGRAASPNVRTAWSILRAAL